MSQLTKHILVMLTHLRLPLTPIQCLSLPVSLQFHSVFFFFPFFFQQSVNLHSLPPASVSSQSVFRSSPLLGCFLFGLPLGVISLMCYGMCTAESDDGADDMELMKREGLTDEEEEEEEEERRRQAAKLEEYEEGEGGGDGAELQQQEEKSPEEKKAD